MKTAVVLLLSCAALGYAQDAKPETVKRLESVTWDLATHKLIWLVEKGTVVDGEFVASSKVKYEVSPDDAFMAFAGEQRAVREDEAAALHQLLDALSLYCVESVVWWDHGEADAPATRSPGVVTKPEQPAPREHPVEPNLPGPPAGRVVKVSDRGPRQPVKLMTERELVAAKER